MTRFTSLVAGGVVVVPWTAPAGYACLECPVFGGVACQTFVSGSPCATGRRAGVMAGKAGRSAVVEVPADAGTGIYAKLPEK